MEEGRGLGRRSKREGTCVYIQLIYFIVQQKLTQHYKAITFQFKKSVKERSEIKTVVSFYSVSIFLVRTEIYVNILIMKHEL